MDEMITICPEGLEVATVYLEEGQDSMAVANRLNLPIEEVDRLLNKREVKNFIDRVFNETGFRNKHRMAELMDAIIAKKLEEMDDTGLGSQADILDILKLAHNMKMKEMEMEIKMLQAKTSQPAIQVNTQINGGGDQYNKLLEKILNAGK